jgi:hypothetical protein
MDSAPLAGELFLYALATISITFVGFSALLIVFRQTMGGKLTPYDTYFTLSFIQIGFIVAAGSLLPTVAALYGIDHDAAWRVASGIVAPFLIWFVSSVPGRRRAATGKPVPAFIKASLTVQWGCALALVACAAGLAKGHGAPLYATALMLILISSFVAYLLALTVILPEIHKSS